MYATAFADVAPHCSNVQQSFPQPEGISCTHPPSGDRMFDFWALSSAEPSLAVVRSKLGDHRARRTPNEVRPRPSRAIASFIGEAFCPRRGGVPVRKPIWAGY